MKQLLTLIFALLFTITSFSQLQHIEFPFPDVILRDVEILSPNTFLVSSYTNDKLYKTTDGGLSWTYTEHYPGHPTALKTMHYFSEDVGIIRNALFSPNSFDIDNIFKTTNGGITWDNITPKDSSSFSNRIGIQFFFSREIGLCSLNNNLYRTTDGGESWTRIMELGYTPNFDFNYNGEAYVVFGLSTDNNFRFYYTSNYGETWDLKTIQQQPSTDISPIKVQMYEDLAYIISDKNYHVFEKGTLK